MALQVFFSIYVVSPPEMNAPSAPVLLFHWALTER